VYVSVQFFKTRQLISATRNLVFPTSVNNPMHCRRPWLQGIMRKHYLGCNLHFDEIS
jgi:hypothetical protein